MKKLFLVLVFIIILSLLNSIACAEQINYSELSDDELYKIVTLARNELMKREVTINENTVVLIDNEYVYFYLTGSYSYSNSSTFLQLDAVMVNRTDEKLSVNAEHFSINGWEMWEGLICNAEGQKKTKATLNMKLSNANITSLDELQEIEIAFYVNDSNYHRIYTTDIQHLHLLSN